MIQSSNDKKKYRSITLTNKLRVLLIENTESTKSAAALAVNAGHFNDPKTRQGLAHFLEHMLFLGTKKYPDGSEYQQFISQHHGNHNAWTGTEHTCFFLDIHHQYFTEALARFSDFFTSPLLSQAFIDKERKNIDAEFKLKLKDDIRRLYDVHKETINPAHPFSQFSVGNNETLADREQDNIQQELTTFFENYYCAEHMTLALEGPQSLDTLQTIAEQYFSLIKQANTPIADIEEPLYLPEHQNIQINVCPVKNDRQLIINFAMPSIDQYYKDKPESIIAYLLGHEGPGSILSHLKMKQWAFRLTAGSGINGSNFKDFNISVALTELGEQHINDIVTIVFQYIALLKNKPIHLDYFLEKKSIAMLAFDYLEKLKPIDSVSQLVINMQHYPPEHYIFGDYMMEHFNTHSLTTLLSYLTSQNMRLLHISKKNTFDKTSQWYQVPYQVNPIDSELLKVWQQNGETKTQLNHLYLPSKNNYIVQNPIIVEQETDQHLPEVLFQTSGFTAWFKQDQTFKVPKGYIYLGIDCPKTLETTTTIAMTKLFIEIYSDNVIEENYDAELAGIHYHLYAHQGGMTLQLSGISEKQPILLNKLLVSLMYHEINPNKFALLKKQLLNHWNNADKTKSISQLFSTLSSTLQPNKPSTEELYLSLLSITFDDFIFFTKSIFKQVNLELFIHGNWRKNDALGIIDQIENAFSGRYSADNLVDVAVLDNSGIGEHTLPITLPEHDHAAVIYYPMKDRNLETISISMVLSQLFSPHFFQEMRTEQQFGYLVGVGYVPIGYYPGIALYIQSPNTTAPDLVKAMDIFIKKSTTLINNISQDEWLQLQHGLIGQLQESDSSLHIKSQRFWGALCNKDHSFDRKQKLIEQIKKLNLTMLIHFIQETLTTIERSDRILLMSVKSIKELNSLERNVISTEKLKDVCTLKY